jgi:ribosomal protein L37AE/L43A
LMLDALEPFRTALAKQHPAKLKDTQAVAASAPAVLDMEADCIPQPKSGQMTSKSVVATAWQEDEGIELAADAWKQQRHALQLPCCDWAGRRRYCADVNSCEACARYVAGGKQFSYAPMSQRLLDVLASAGAYGSHREAHAAGWRWNASPNHGQSSHAHQWWPPQKAVQEHLAGVKLPLGTYKAFDVVNAMF